MVCYILLAVFGLLLLTIRGGSPLNQLKTSRHCVECGLSLPSQSSGKQALTSPWLPIQEHAPNRWLATSKEDVLDEAERLDALDHVEAVDFDQDENLVDMDAVSPAMRDMFTS